jgi:hypothetical protein
LVGVSNTKFHVDRSSLLLSSLSTGTVRITFVPGDSTNQYGISLFSVDNPMDLANVSLEGALSDSIGDTTRSSGNDSALPSYFTFGPAYPNPTSNTSRIEFDVPTLSPVRLWITDGRQYFEELINNTFTPGHHSVMWDCRQVPTGIYRAFISTPNWSCFGDIEVRR